MSKSKKNVINPDDILNEYGADAFRMYEMFMGPFEASKPWDMQGIEGISRYLKRVWHWGNNVKLSEESEQKEVGVLKHRTIVKVETDIQNFGFNTAISNLMILFNEIGKKQEINADTFKVFMQLLHPFAPHITEALWQEKGFEGYIVQTKWPRADKAMLEDSELDIGVQVNGKLRGRIKTAVSASEDELKTAALADENVKRFTEGKEIVKILIIPKKIISVVVK
jgi:leucyl-tRNA synthetase